MIRFVRSLVAGVRRRLLLRDLDAALQHAAARVLASSTHPPAVARTALLLTLADVAEVAAAIRAGIAVFEAPRHLAPSLVAFWPNGPDEEDATSIARAALSAERRSLGAPEDAFVVLALAHFFLDARPVLR